MSVFLLLASSLTIHKLHTSLLINRISISPHFPPPFTPPNFSSFTCVTTNEVSKLFSQSPDTNCDLDHIPASLQKQCSHILLPTITKIINLSLSTGIFPDQFKNCSVHPHLKKSYLDKDDLCNYRLISHLSFLSKLTERVVKLRLADYSSTNNLLNSFQSAYIKHHSTETTLLSVHDQIIKAMSHLSHSSWLICCFWHYRSFYYSWTPFILVWHFFYCSLLDQILFTKPFFLCQYWKL